MRFGIEDFAFKVYDPHSFYGNVLLVDTVNYNKTTFALSAVELDQLPTDEGNEVAFIGRSNAGKSSAINAITGIKGLARTSKTPGRTQAVNVFKLDNHNRFIDLPGYGYTKAPATVSKAWTERSNLYLKTRQCLRGLILIMDVRHPLTPQDQQLIDWCIKCELPVHILLSKADKLKKIPATETLHEIEKTLAKHKSLISIQLFSAHDLIGIDIVKQKLDHWFMHPLQLSH